MSVFGSWQGLCLPVKIYVVLQMIGIVLLLIAANRVPDFGLGRVLVLAAILAISMLLMAWFMQLLCKEGREGWAWFLLVGWPLIQIIASVYLFYPFRN